MNRAQRRKLEKQGVKVPKDPTINIKMSELGKCVMSPKMEAAMMHEIHQQCLAADKKLTLDIFSMVLWTLHTHLGFGPKRLHDFYVAMDTEHQRMRDYYEMDDCYPEYFKLKELGADIEAWQEEIE